MVARVWRGATRSEDADAYLSFLRSVDFGYPAAAGYLGVIALRDVGPERAEFMLVTFWESDAAIREFAGNDIARAVFFPEDDRFLIERGERVKHYEVASRLDRSGTAER